MLWWVVESQVWVVKEHREGLRKCKEAGSITAALVLVWAPIMCFPQWFVALVFAIVGGHIEAGAIFYARVAAMCIVRKLDDHIPLTRALGLCHLLTFGPVFLWLLSREPITVTSSFFKWFLWFEMRVIVLCLLLDTRDLLFHLAGYPYPCYIREGARAGALKVEDPRAHAAVTWFSILLGP